MQDINNWTGTGRLTRDAELKYTSGGMAVAKFSIAVNRSVKKGDAYEETASFFDCILWGKFAEAMNQHLTKGKQVMISGELNQTRWEQDGQARSRVEITIDRLMLGGSPQANGYHAGQTDASAGVPGAIDEDIPY